MRRICLALIAGLLAAGASTGAAAADGLAPSAPSEQTAGQVATSGQWADSSATSTQIAPKNTNVNVRVLSPGTNGPVSQTNSSTAGALAANANATDQSTEQAGGGNQTAGQLAGNLQDASATADSTQVKPENTNVDVRVLSPGDDGEVTQENSSSAAAIAANLNKTDQELEQESDGPAVQSAGQAALSKQGASAEAESKQIAPKNTNVGVRVLSPGNDGAVTQRNDSSAKAIAANANSTKQDIEQEADGGRGGDWTSQTAGQLAGNLQGAEASALSKQIEPSNTNADVRVLSPGHGGDVTQANTSSAVGVALNANHTSQSIEQELEGNGKDGKDGCCRDGHKGDVTVQAAGQVAGNLQGASATAESVQVHPENTNLSKGDPGSVRQRNESSALGVAANFNGLDQSIDQDAGDEKKAKPLLADENSGLTEALAEAIVAPRAGTEQSNDSKATSLAVNLNKTQQEIEQEQEGRSADVGVQAAGQVAENKQYADSAATSFQYGAQNRNFGVGLMPVPCKRDRCTPEPCGYDRCKPDMCGYDRCKLDPCKEKRSTRDPCGDPKWCSHGCDKRIAPKPWPDPAGSEVGPLAA
jgi:hypothetical protein